MWKQVKVLHVEPEVPQQLRVVQVVRVVRRHREITEAHHLLAGVGHQRTVDARSARLQGLLEARRRRAEKKKKGWMYMRSRSCFGNNRLDRSLRELR